MQNHVEKQGCYTKISSFLFNHLLIFIGVLVVIKLQLNLPE